MSSAVASGAQVVPATCRRAVAGAVLAQPGEESSTARVAADALVAAAGIGDAAALAEVLRPDPTVPVPVWTVARYQAGDVSPRTLEHHDDPCAAVLATAARGAADEATAELIAVSGGLRWTPLVRGHGGLTFHPPEAWALAESEASGSEAAAAAERWRRRSRLWADVPRDVPRAAVEEAVPPAPSSTPRRATGSLASAIAAAVAGAVDGWPGRDDVAVDDVVAEVRRHLGSAGAPPLPPAPRRSADGSAVVGGDVSLPILAALTARLEAAAAAHERSAAALTALVEELRQSRSESA